MSGSPLQALFGKTEGSHEVEATHWLLKERMPLFQMSRDETYERLMDPIFGEHPKDYSLDKTDDMNPYVVTRNTKKNRDLYQIYLEKFSEENKKCFWSKDDVSRDISEESLKMVKEVPKTETVFFQKNNDFFKNIDSLERLGYLVSDEAILQLIYHTLQTQTDFFTILEGAAATFKFNWNPQVECTEIYKLVQLGNQREAFAKLQSITKPPECVIKYSFIMGQNPQQQKGFKKFQFQLFFTVLSINFSARLFWHCMQQRIHISGILSNVMSEAEQGFLLWNFMKIGLAYAYYNNFAREQIQTYYFSNIYQILGLTFKVELEKVKHDVIAQEGIKKMEAKLRKRRDPEEDDPFSEEIEKLQDMIDDLKPVLPTQGPQTERQLAGIDLKSLQSDIQREMIRKQGKILTSTELINRSEEDDFGFSRLSLAPKPKSKPGGGKRK